MSDTRPGTIRYRRNKYKINIGVLICIIVILYFVAYFCVFLFSSDNEFFEVTEGSTSSGFDGQYTALILRSEKVINASGSGYVSFFVGDAVPVSVGQQAYVIDRSEELSHRLKTAAENQALLNENDLNLLKDSLYDFDTSFDREDFFDTYNFRYKIESQILDLINNSIFETDKSSFNSSSYTIVDSGYAGIAMHYIDGFEDVTKDSFEASSFKRTEYNKQIIKTNDYINAGSPIFKIITSENWNLVFQVQDPKIFENLDVITIEFLKDNVKATCNFELIARGGNYYGIVYLDKYMIRYASERYVQISITDDTYRGLKIPKTSVTEKTYYVIPVSYKTLGGNTRNYGFLLKSKNGSGEDLGQIVFPEIIKETSEYCYVSMDSFEQGDILYKTDSENQFQIGTKDTLEGVYVYNGGDTYFRTVDIIGENDGYYIINSSSDNTLRMYDQIYVNYEDAENHAQR